MPHGATSPVRKAQRQQGLAIAVRASAPFTVQALYRLVVVTGLFSILLFAPAIAQAAPMCNELAQSIEAPPPEFPSQNTVITGLSHCRSLDVIARLKAGSPSQDFVPKPWLDTSDRHLASATSVPKVPIAARIDVPRAVTAEPRPSYGPSIYRPPRLTG